MCIHINSYKSWHVCPQNPVAAVVQRQTWEIAEELGWVYK